MKSSLPVDQTRFEIKRAGILPAQSKTSQIRGIPMLAACTQQSWRTAPQLRLLDSASGYPADEAIEKEIVRDRHRDAGNQSAGHDLSPEENVTADEIGRHAKRDRLLIRCGYESQRVDEFLQG